MMQTPFHAYYTALKLNSLQDEDKLLPVFSEGNINVYPYQVAAALFAMRNPYQKGVILCDEAGMGKSHEAMLIISELWYEGKAKILIAIPNPDLLMQWAEMIEDKYTLPFCIASDNKSFDYDGIVLTTYDYLTQNIEEADKVNWDVIVFEEANALSSVYQDENTFMGSAGSKQAKLLKEFSKDTFKILLTGTPIEKNIMDLYGLIYFIDDELLPEPDTYMKRYLRKPENYPELAEKVSKYCFRTLRSQAKQYAKIPERLHITLEYEGSDEEKELYNLLFAYIEKPNKTAFPQMEQYDLALILLGLLSSSTAAIKQSIKNIIKRLEKADDTEELTDFQKMLDVAENITSDTKAELLIKALQKLFPYLKKMGANQKAVIFTESVETQKYLYGILKGNYKTLIYNGQASTDYEVIKQFKADGEILISTDNGAKGYNLEESSLVINYDLLYNTLKMEQRIDRIHRINQQNDCIVVSFINKGNFADVRKLELVSKRHILSDGVFGVSDSVIGGFTDNFDKALKELNARTKKQVEQDYQNTLDKNETDNRQIVESAENILFTTFTKELYDNIKTSPQYVEEKSKEINDELWELVKFYFEDYNKNKTDCTFVIDDEKRTVKATNYDELPHLFYYPSNSGNKPYRSLKEFKNISLLSPLARGIIFNFECADFGEMTTGGEKCTIALYLIKVYAGRREIKNYPVFVGITEDGQRLFHSECERIFYSPVSSYTEDGHKSAFWIKYLSHPHKMDSLVNRKEYEEKENEKLTPAQHEEIERMKLAATVKKNGLNHALDEMELQMKELTNELEAVKNDRLKLLTVERKVSQLKNEMLKKKEGLFFDEMQIDVDLEKNINEFLGRETISIRADRQFVLEIN